MKVKDVTIRLQVSSDVADPEILVEVLRELVIDRMDGLDGTVFGIWGMEMSDEYDLPPSRSRGSGEWYMKKEDVQKVQPGDYIELESRLGKGKVEQVLMDEITGKNCPRGTFPMIQFRNSVTKELTWCTYIVVRKYVPANEFAGLFSATGIEHLRRRGLPIPQD